MPATAAAPVGSPRISGVLMISSLSVAALAIGEAFGMAKPCGKPANQP
jgi:hypothetical protein